MRRWRAGSWRAPSRGSRSGVSRWGWPWWLWGQGDFEDDGAGADGVYWMLIHGGAGDGEAMAVQPAEQVCPARTTPVEGLPAEAVSRTTRPVWGKGRESVLHGDHPFCVARR